MVAVLAVQKHRKGQDMKKNKNAVINETVITLREIKYHIDSTRGVALPTAKALRENESIILLGRKTTEDSVMEVYSNGFAVYQKPHHQAILRMEYVGKAKYEKYNAETGTVKKESYNLEDTDWSIAVMMTGEERMELRYEEKYEKTMISTTGTGYREEGEEEAEDMELDAGVDVAGLVGEADELHSILDCLTDRQREVVTMYYLEQFTQGEIADKLGIKQRAVSYHLEAAMKKLKNNLK